MAQFVLVPRSVLRSVLLPVQRMTRAFPRPRHRDQRTAGTINAEQATALQGFALLLALGDEAAATRASHAALRAGAGGRDALDARLRHRALRALDPAWGQVPRLLRGRPLLDPERRAALRQLGVNDIGLEGLASMAPAERAALIASAAEGMDEAGVARVVGLHARFSRVLLGRARRRYLATTSAFLDENPWARREIGGPLARRIRRTAGRARGAEAAAVGDHASCWAWLAGGAGGRPSAPMSVHATACQACAKAIVALDALHAIDTSRADGPAPL
ncbi:MAG TPA: hypothetical protein VFK61_04185, partial [Candidatus Limnocylindria bacterium]|nr:hypothetical protein [Candidatus Limnocylindria bacterium]